MLPVPLAHGAPAEIRLIVVASPSPSDVTATLPPTLSYVHESTPFYCEVWAQTTNASGLSSVSLDLLFDPVLVSGVSIIHSTLFGGLTNGSIDNTSGVIDDLSGSHVGPCTDAVAVAPNWARVAIIDMSAIGYGTTSLQAAATGSPAFGTAICGVGDISPAQIQYSAAALGIGEPLVPTVSQWGLVILALCLLLAGTVVLRGRRRLA